MAPERYDIVVFGGALGGAATALLLRRRHPGLRVLIVERSEAFDWKVGESTVEVSSYFLTRVLNLHDHLSREHLPKQGLRFWFHNGEVSRVQEASEFGPDQLPRIGSFQVDRSKLDEHVLRLAVGAGAELRRPAKVTEVELAEEHGAPDNVVRIHRDGQTEEINAGWVVDASGRAAIIARKQGMLHPVTEHPISSVWARFRGVKDLDGPEIMGSDPDSPYARASVPSRRLATNHFNGWGYWIWFIALRGGETSIGAVWDRRLVEPGGHSAEECLRWFLSENPLTRQLTTDAEPVPGDIRSYAHLPYRVDRVAGRGWSLVGDAAGFVDPFFSPGLDQVAITVSWTMELLNRSRASTDVNMFIKVLEDHNKAFERNIRGLFQALYQDKYYLLGDYDTMLSSVLIDTSLYYFFVVFPIYRRSSRHLLNGPFYRSYSEVAIRIMEFYKSRLIKIAKRKRSLGIYGNRNAGRRPRTPGFSLSFANTLMLCHGLARYFRAEAEHAWSFIARPRPLRFGMPTPLQGDRDYDGF